MPTRYARSAKRLGRPRIAEQQEPTSARILKVAAKFFMENGFEGVRIEEIAEQCEVTKAVVYYYFNSKADLFVASMKSTMETVYYITKQILESDQPFYDRLLTVAIARLNLASTLEMHAIMRGTDKMLTDAQRDEMEKAELRLYELLVDAFKRAESEHEITRIEPEVGAWIYFSALNSTYFAHHHVNPDPQVLAQSLLDALFSGIGKIHEGE